MLTAWSKCGEFAIARAPRIDLPGVPQHVVQRGVNRCACFLCEEDCLFYLRTLRRVARDRDCCIHAYVLMTNHVHLLVTPDGAGALSLMMQDLGRTYVQYFNRRTDRTGTLWEGRYKASLVDSARYLLMCYRYIELNPVRAGMVKKAIDYRWSSVHSNARGASDELVCPHDVYYNLGADSLTRRREYLRLLNDELKAEELEEIRAHLNQGKVLGEEGFQIQVAKRIGRSVSVRPVGRPPNPLRMPARIGSDPVP